MVNVRRLPRTGTDNEVVTDVYGNRWVFDLQQNIWQSRGAVGSIEEATEQRAGLMPADVYRRLQLVKSAAAGRLDALRPFKILPGSDAYWYYFRSGDHHFRFIPEGEDSLRIEVDRTRLFRLLINRVCQGPRGPKGDRGDRGPIGKAGLPEPCFSPQISGKSLKFAVFAPNFYDTDMVVRLYRSPTTQVQAQAAQAGPANQSQPSATGQIGYLRKQVRMQQLGREWLDHFATIETNYQRKQLGSQAASVCDIPLSPLQSAAPTGLPDPSYVLSLKLGASTEEGDELSVVKSALTLDLEATEIRYDRELQIVCGTIVLKDDLWQSGWCLKARQQGQKGQKGPQGSCMLSIVECEADSTNILATCPIVNVRLDCAQDILYWVCSDIITGLVCVDNVVVAGNSAPIADQPALKSVFAAAQITTDSCKSINRFEVEIDSYELPELSFTHWSPQPGCVTRRSYDRHKFNWVPETDLPACNDKAKWFGATSGMRGVKYPWRLVRSKRPLAEEEACCQDEFFYCPNVQSNCGGGFTAQSAKATEDIPDDLA